MRKMLGRKYSYFSTNYPRKCRNEAINRPT